MATKSAIRESLEREVDKLVSRYNSFCRISVDDRKLYEKRTGNTAGVMASSHPPHWDAHPHFNPFYIRARIDSIAHSIIGKIRENSYKPNPSLLMEIPKPDGGNRKISVFTIPDAAVSYWLNRRLVDRNAHRFSSYTYAYRSDRNAHHAIDNLMTAIRNKSRVFVLEYDFAKYFDSIRHNYLEETLERFFRVAKNEWDIIKKILGNQRAQCVPNYKKRIFESVERGIPQGSTISLFLANVACYELDREIERVGVVFARYADDTLILCENYEKADICAKLLIEHGQRSGTEINFEKSAGISLLTKDSKPEFRPKSYVFFLGHSLSNDGVKISEKSINRIKKRISTIVYNNLLLQPKRGKLHPDRVGPGFHDWDLVTCINELRRYIYGRISENALSEAITGKGFVNITWCAMSFYPTADGAARDQIKQLDGWLLDIVHRTYIKRTKLLESLGISVSPVSKKDLISGVWYNYSSVPVETKLPSLYSSWLYVKKAAQIYGLAKFPSPLYEYV